MDRNHLFSIALAAATMGLTACGGSDNVAATGGGTQTTAPITPASVACAAPDTGDFQNTSRYASVCIPASSGGTSSRYDLTPFGSGAQAYKLDFANSNCTGTATTAGYSAFGWTVASTTTTVPSLAADGITPVTGSGRTVTVNTIFSSSGSFASGTPLVTTGTYTICKTTPPSTTTMRVLQNYASTSSTAGLTASFVLRSSAAGTSTINTQFGFEGSQLLNIQ